MKRLLLIIVIACVAQACDTSRMYEMNYDLPNKVWVSDSVLNFQFEIENIDQPTNLYYNIRNTLSYPFQNLYVKYTLQDTLGNVYDQNLINQDLFDVKTGRPLGSGLGDVFDHQFELLKNYKFDRTGKYEVLLQHYMRPDTLKDVISVGIRLERVQ